MQFRQSLYSAIEGERALDASLQQLSLQPVSAAIVSSSVKMPTRYEFDSKRKWVQKTSVFSKFHDGLFHSPRTRSLAAISETLWAKCIGDNVILSRWNPGDRRSARKFVVSCQPSEEAGYFLTPGLTGIVANSDRSRLLIHGLRSYPTLCNLATLQLDAGFSKNSPELGDVVSASSYAGSHPALFAALTLDGMLSVIDTRLPRQQQGFSVAGDELVTAWDCDIHPNGYHVAAGLTCGAALHDDYANIVNRSWSQIHNLENSFSDVSRQICVFDVRYTRPGLSSIRRIAEIKLDDTPCRVRWAPSKEKRILAALLRSGIDEARVKVYDLSQTDTASVVLETGPAPYSSISWLGATGTSISTNQLWMSLSCDTDAGNEHNVRIAKFSRNFDSKLFDDDDHDRTLDSLRVYIQHRKKRISKMALLTASCILDASVVASTAHPGSCILSTVHPRGAHATIQCKTVNKQSSFVM